MHPTELEAPFRDIYLVVLYCTDPPPIVNDGNSIHSAVPSSSSSSSSPPQQQQQQHLIIPLLTSNCLRLLGRWKNARILCCIQCSDEYMQLYSSLVQASQSAGHSVTVIDGTCQYNPPPSFFSFYLSPPPIPPPPPPPTAKREFFLFFTHLFF